MTLSPPSVPKVWAIPVPAWFWAWAKWRFAGQTYPRPETTPKLIPLWAWNRLAWLAYMRAKAALPPPPKPAEIPPPPPTPFDFWRTKGGWVAWGLAVGTFTPEKLIRLCVGRGIRWVGIEGSQYTDTQLIQHRDALHAAGLKLVLWEGNQQVFPGTYPATINRIRAVEPDGYVVNVEHRPGDWTNFCNTVRSSFRQLPLGVFTTYFGAGSTAAGTYSREDARPFWDNAFACIPEAYVWSESGFNPNYSPAQLDWVGKTQLGYPETFPAVGIYAAGSKPEWYDGYLANYPHHSYYLLEYLPELS